MGQRQISYTGVRVLPLSLKPKTKQDIEDFKDKPHLVPSSIPNSLLKYPEYPDILFDFDLKHAHSIFFGSGLSRLGKAVCFFIRRSPTDYAMLND
jgi:hypothetical protein